EGGAGGPGLDRPARPRFRGDRAPGAGPGRPGLARAPPPAPPDGLRRRGLKLRARALHPDPDPAARRLVGADAVPAAPAHHRPAPLPVAVAGSSDGAVRGTGDQGGGVLPPAPARRVGVPRPVRRADRGPRAVKRGRILSGMRPTGRLHLGNYVGALENWVRLQDEGWENFHMVADWHMLTTGHEDTSHLQSDITDMVLDWLAAGLDPK